KDRILTAYLNDIYFGREAYGIEAAAATYFGVHAKDLPLEQAALLAGLPQAPSRLTRSPGRAPHAPDAPRCSRRCWRTVTSPLPATERRSIPPRPPPTSGARACRRDLPDRLHHLAARRPVRGGARPARRPPYLLDARKQTEASHAILGTLDSRGDPAAPSS